MFIVIGTLISSIGAMMGALGGGVGAGVGAGVDDLLLENGNHFLLENGSALVFG